MDVPALFSQCDYESHEVEDPRIVKIDELFYLTYAAYDGVGVLSVSKDLLHWERQGIIVPQITYREFNRFAGSKFPLNEKYLRYNELERVIKPDIQIGCINELTKLTPDFWQNYFLHFDENIVITPKYEHEVSYVGGGSPPIETKHGWIMIYYGVCDTLEGYVYSGCAALLDLENLY